MEAIALVIIFFLAIVNLTRIAHLLIFGDIYTQLSLLKRNKPKRYKPFVSIVVPAFNEEGVIYSCLQSIFSSTYENFEVLVINDGSSDNTSSVIRSFRRHFRLGNLRLLEQANAGKANALNYAIKNFAKGELIMVLDADSLLDKDALKKAVFYFQDERVATLASNVRIIKQKGLLGAIQHIEYLIGYRLKKAYTVLNNEYIIGGIGSVFRKSILRAVNYYDINTVTEDIDLTMKIAALGNKANRLIYASDVLCYTQAVVSLPDLLKQRFRWKYGRFQTLWKNKQMLLNTDPKYSKLLTFVQLPFVLYSEFIFLFDPLLIIYLIYIEARYREIRTFLSVMVFFTSYTFLAILSDEHSKLKNKIIYLLLSPFSYFFFLVISAVEYLALIKSIREYRGIIKIKEEGNCNWIHVERA